MVDIKEICQKIVDKFNSEFIEKYHGKTDPEQILNFDNVTDDPNELNKQLAEIPALYAYWASMKRSALQNLEKLKNQLEMFKQQHIQEAVDLLVAMGVKTPTVAKIELQIDTMFVNNVKYKAFGDAIKKADETYEKIFVIEKAVLTKLDCLKVIAQLTNGMMNTGIYVKKFEPKPNQKKGEY